MIILQGERLGLYLLIFRSLNEKMAAKDAVLA